MRLAYLALWSCACTTALLAQPTMLVPGYDLTQFHQEPTGSLITSLTVDDQNRLYMVNQSGHIKVLEDQNGDGVAETITTYWNGTGIAPVPSVGLLWFQGWVYLSARGSIKRLRDIDGDLVADTVTNIATLLPNGWHHNNDLFTDGTSIYFGLGSASDHDVDPDPRSATVMRMAPDGSAMTIYATGLRNVFDGIVHPVSGELFVGDNGPNLVAGNPDPPEEIDRILPTRDYGHPNNWGIPPIGAANESPILELTSHASPCGMAINPTTGISGHRNEMVMVTFSSVGANLVRLPLHYGVLTNFPGTWTEDFAQDFTTPIDLQFDQTGALFVAEYSPGTVWSIRQASPARTIIESQTSVGMTCNLTFSAPGFPGDVIFAAASTGLGPAPVPIGNGYGIYLDTTSPFWLFSMAPNNGIFNLPAPGILDAAGNATGSILIPNVPSLVGFFVEVQFLVGSVATGTPVASSPPLRVTVQVAW